MLTSLNVVRMAAVDCDCTRRSAMRARKRLIGTRCSGRFPRICSTPTGAGGWGKEGFAAVGASGAGGLFAPSTSSFVTRRSEEHTSELQSRLHLVCRLLLEKKKK